MIVVVGYGNAVCLVAVFINAKSILSIWNLASIYMYQTFGVLDDGHSFIEALALSFATITSIKYKRDGPGDSQMTNNAKCWIMKTICAHSLYPIQ